MTLIAAAAKVIGGNYAILWQSDAPRLLHEYLHDIGYKPRSLAGILDPISRRRTSVNSKTSKSSRRSICRDIYAYPEIPLQHVKKGARNRSIFNYVRTNCNSNYIEVLKSAALQANDSLNDPLPLREVVGIAESISRARSRQSASYAERVGAYSPEQR